MYDYFVIVCQNIYVNLTFLVQKVEGGGNGNELITIFGSQWRPAYESQKASSSLTICVGRVVYQEHEYNKKVPNQMYEFPPLITQCIW